MRCGYRLLWLGGIDIIKDIRKSNINNFDVIIYLYLTKKIIKT